jgi:hypothetical protein
VYHFAREHVERQDVAFQYISTQHMDADVLTKAVPAEKAASVVMGWVSAMLL